MTLGAEVSDEHLNAVIEIQRANECCTLIYTSGTTGTPKGVMLSHDNVSVSLCITRYHFISVLISITSSLAILLRHISWQKRM